MDEVKQAYPLDWPPTWRRTSMHLRKRAKFVKQVNGYQDVWRNGQKVKEYGRLRDRELSVSDATLRVRAELERMGIDSDDVVISSNVELRLDGLPRSGQRQPADPGACVYWRKGKTARCMAIDLYDRVEDNLAAIAATLDAMRAIERHGGAAILDRAFMGFAALPAPEQPWQVLELETSFPTRQEIDEAHRRLAMKHHPDRGGSHDAMSRINTARDELLARLT